MPAPLNRLTPLDLTVALMERAARSNLRTPGRRGFLVELPARGDILVCGDIHGNRENLEKIIAIADLDRHPHRHLVVHELIHGDEAAGATRSHRLVETIARLKVAAPDRVHYLLGNHEFAELLALDIGKNGRLLNDEFAEGLQKAFGERWKEAFGAYRQFWRSCPVAIRTANRLFIAHSTPRLERAPEFGLEYLRNARPDEFLKRKSPAFHMLWGRDYRPQVADALSTALEADVFIVGHTPCEEGVRLPNHRHVILDSTTRDGCYAILPLDRPLTQSDVAQRVKRIFGARG